MSAEDLLASWRDTTTKRAIVEFVARASTEAGRLFPTGLAAVRAYRRR